MGELIGRLHPNFGFRVRASPPPKILSRIHQPENQGAPSGGRARNVHFQIMAPKIWKTSNRLHATTTGSGNRLASLGEKPPACYSGIKSDNHVKSVVICSPEEWNKYTTNILKKVFNLVLHEPHWGRALCARNAQKSLQLGTSWTTLRKTTRNFILLFIR